jgi:DNA-binding transcriptional LysR family regulator
MGHTQQTMAGVRFLLKEMVSGEQIENLLTGRIDIGLLRPPVRRAELAAMPVLRERFVVCSHTSVPQASRPCRLADFDGLPIIMYAQDKARYFHDLLTGLFAQAKAEPHFVQHLAQIHTILMLVSAGHGFALVPESSVRLHPEDVVFNALEDCDPIVELHAAWREANENPALAVLLQQLRDWPRQPLSE